jgi:hypothetical protein
MLRDGGFQQLETLAATDQVYEVIATTTPEHEAFIQQALKSIWSNEPLNRKRSSILALYRPLLPAASICALSRLDPEVLIARLKAETSKDDLAA